MTVVNLTALVTELGGPGVAALGWVEVDYWAGRRPVTRIDGADVVFPATIRVPVRDGAPEATLDLVPTGGLCCVRWSVTVRGSSTLTVYTEVPATGPVDFGALVQVDPDTFVPTGEVVAAWEAAILQVKAIRDDMLGTATDEVVAGILADDGSDSRAALSVAVGAQIVTDAKDSTGTALSTLPVADARTLRAPLGDTFARAGATPNFRRVQTDVFPFTAQPFTSWTSFVVVRVEGLIPAPLAKYYVYYSTDHHAGAGGIGLLLWGGPGTTMTSHGQVYVDLVEGKQTETPDVHWNPDVALVQYGAGLAASTSGTIAQVPGDLLTNGQPVRIADPGSTGLATTGTYYVVQATGTTFKLAGFPGGPAVTIAANSTVTVNLVGALVMYYQQDMIATRDQQLTLAAYSRDGLAWTRIGVVIDGNKAVYAKHTGYAKIARVGRKWVAYHLIAGGAVAVQGISWSDDGIAWWTDPHPIMWDVNFAGAGGDLDPDFKVSWIGVRPFLYGGQYWTIVPSTPFGDFGGQFAELHMTVAPLAPDFRRFAAPPVKVDLDQTLPGEGRLGGNPGNLFLHDDGLIYGLYLSSQIEDPTTDWTKTSLGLIRLEAA